MKKETTLKLTTFDNQPRWDNIEFQSGKTVFTISQCPDLDIEFNIENSNGAKMFYLEKEDVEELIKFLQNQLKLNQD
jgi:hypothetical protein